MNETIVGIILDRSDYKEHDALMRVLTSTHGVITWIAKGVNRPKSKYNGLLQPFVEVEALVDLKPGISLFKNATSKTINSHLSESIEVLAMASFLNKILAGNAREENRLVTYDEFKQYLSILSPSNYFEVGTHFLMKLAKDMGMELYLDGCVVCHQPKIVGVSLSAGGFVCQQHLASNHYHLFDKEFLKQLRCLSKANLSQLEQCVGPTQIEHMQLYVTLLGDTLKIPGKNWRFISQL